MNFDDLDEGVPALAKPEAEPKATRRGDPWRLGHRRPWWQWNVLTLFGALFALVWLREMAELSSGATWFVCLFVFAVWVLAPMPSLEPAPTRDNEPSPAVPRALAVALAIMTFVGVYALGGLAVCALALLGAMFYAMAVRPR
jgi:quinol-cytochrome oxidoreductase complex cytochrome b subunit